MTTLHARTALTEEGWRRDVRLEIDGSGTIAALASGVGSAGAVVGKDRDRAAEVDDGHGDGDGDGVGDEAIDAGAEVTVDVLLPAPANLHSHAFQRAIAGRTERRGPDGRDSFWSWRETMYRFLERLDPDDVEAIAAFAQMEMLEAGFAAVAEFHYLHHGPGGVPYADLGELSARIAAAARTSGIGLTLLPVLYVAGGCDGRALAGGQRRFGNEETRFAALHERAAVAVRALPDDARLGVAAHSLRAVSPAQLRTATALAPRAPFHLHIAEQPAEVDEVRRALGARPIEWLLGNHDVDARWCLIHATQATDAELDGLARSGAVAGLCPITEANLGDGLFGARRYLDAGGALGVGSDSNLRISLAGELRTLEHGQRLRDGERAVLADATRSTGRRLLEEACAGGARAAGRASGAIAPGRLADLVALDGKATSLLGTEEDTTIDAFAFAGGDDAITDVWAAGRHVVREGRHVRREAIERRYRETVLGLSART